MAARMTWKMRPDRDSDTQRGQKLRQPEEEKEFPEQTTHAGSPASIKHQLVTLADHGLDRRTPVRQVAEFVPNAADMDVDAAIKPAQ